MGRFAVYSNRQADILINSTMIVYLYPDRKQQTDRLAAASIVTAIGCMAGFFM